MIGVQIAQAWKWFIETVLVIVALDADIHLGYGLTVKPITLKQTAQEIKKQLASRAGHTFHAELSRFFHREVSHL